MKEEINGQIGTCRVCKEKFQMLDDSGRCETCFDDDTESSNPIMQYEAHPFQPMVKS